MTDIESSSVPPGDTDRVTDSPPPPGLGLGTIPGRFALVYPIVFMLPFPLTALTLFRGTPGYSGSWLETAITWVVGLHGQAAQPIVTWLGHWLVGEAPSFEMTGSGDGLAAYLDVLLDFSVATVITLAWWFWRRARPVSWRVRDASYVLVRYFLILIMFSYGFAKVFPMQFQTMGPDRLLQPYGDSSPMGLLWTFMGASAGYQIFGGAAEVLGGALLVFRRTATLGALVVVAVMTNVFALNVFFDVPVKLYSFHYLLMAALLVIPDLPRLFAVFVANRPAGARDLQPFWIGSQRRHYTAIAVKLLFVLSLLGVNIYSGLEDMKTRGPWAPAHELRAVYRVESFEILPQPIPQSAAAAPGDGTPSSASTRDTAVPLPSLDAQGTQAAVPDDVRWVRIGLNPPRSVTVQKANGLAIRMRMRLDEEASTIALYDRSLLEPDSDPLTLERLEQGRLRLSGVFEGQSIDVTLRVDEHKSLFTTRPFRWIAEYPFNR
ncbi:MAG: hypothetical protein AAGM22_15135 [Acidobacteriota bacterium]